MPRTKKSCLARKRKYWYKPKVSEECESDKSAIHIENEDSEFIIANEEEIFSSVSPNKTPKFSDHTYSALTEVSPNVPVTQFADCSVNTEPVVINLCSENSTKSDSVPCSENSTKSDSVPYVPNQYESLHRDLQSVSNFKPFLLNTNSALIQFIELYSSGDKQGVKWTVTIDEYFKAKIVVHNVEVSDEHEFWLGFPAKFKTVKDILKLLDKLSHFSVCCGNPDKEYQNLVPVGVGLSDNKSPGIVAYREGDFAAQKGTLSYSSTIRSTCCSFLVAGSRCSPCSRYRDNLRKRKQRIDERKAAPIPNYVKSTHKHSDMDRDTLILKLKQQKSEIKTLELENMKMKRLFQQQINSKGLLLNEIESMDMRDLMKLCNEDVEKAYPDSNSLQRLFWEQQLRSNKDNAKRSMRWHPMIVRWCLFMRQKSAKAYDAMRESGFINLPSSRTLYDYSHYTKSTLGIQPDVIQMLKTECEKLGMFNKDEPWKCYCGILFDEIKIKSDLVYDKHTGELIGYVDLDKVGNQILEFEKLTREDNVPNVAKCVLVLMVRGITAHLKFPLAAYATTSITADLLYPIVWRAIHHLEVFVKIKVLFCTCDGAAANRKFFNLHKVNDNQNLVYYTQNPHDDRRKIYFISDAPHLLKTTRNCFSNSFSHRNTRKLWKDGRDISWIHIVRLFEEHCEMGLYNPCPRLNRSHIDLTAYSCMKVNLAAQVLSDTVANALEMLYGDCVIETVNFIRLMNKFFDLLNVRNLYEGRNKRNPDLNPYSDPNDDRLQWLENEFLKYFTDWQTSVQNRRGEFSRSQIANMQISHQTLTGLKITVKSVVECVRFMLNEGASFILTHAFNQDPLEQHFGHYRHKGGNNNNPTVYEVRNVLTQIRAIGSQAVVPKQGNIQRLDGNMQAIDNTPLPRRK